VNEEAVALVGAQRHVKKKTLICSFFLLIAHGQTAADGETGRPDMDDDYVYTEQNLVHTAKTVVALLGGLAGPTKFRCKINQLVKNTKLRPSAR
jgi:hypothetical protein